MMLLLKIKTTVKGLEYSSWKAESGNWNYDGKGKWTISEIASEEFFSIIVTFKVLSEGKFINNATAGIGDKNLTTATNSTTALKNNSTSDNKTDSNTNTSKTAKTSKITKKLSKTKKTKENKSFKIHTDKKTTGNPILVLLFVLVILAIRRFFN